MLKVLAHWTTCSWKTSSKSWLWRVCVSCFSIPPLVLWYYHVFFFKKKTKFTASLSIRGNRKFISQISMGLFPLLQKQGSLTLLTGTRTMTFFSHGPHFLNAISKLLKKESTMSIYVLVSSASFLLPVLSENGSNLDLFISSLLKIGYYFPFRMFLHML